MHCSIFPLCIQSNMSPPLTEHTDIGCMMMSLTCAQPAHITAKKKLGRTPAPQNQRCDRIIHWKVCVGHRILPQRERRRFVPFVPLTATLIEAGHAQHTSLAQTGLVTDDVTTSLKHVGSINTTTLWKETARQSEDAYCKFPKQDMKS